MGNGRDRVEQQCEGAATEAGVPDRERQNVERSEKLSRTAKELF